jgi:hypothetical protein
MCPDRQILSLYLDGELPSPWKEKMETHLETCAECRNRLETYRAFSTAPIREEALEAARDRVWRRLNAREPANSTATTLFPRKKAERGLWSRSVTLPLPAAAAVFIIIALFAVLSLRNTGASRVQDVPVAAGIDMDLHGIVPVSDMSGVLQYLSNQDTSDFVIIRLPESRSFSRFGDPALLRAADFSGSPSSR